MTTQELPEQPEPTHLHEARSWLWAAERHQGDPTNERDILARIVAGEALDILSDVVPPYPPPEDHHDPIPLAAALPHAMIALQHAAAADATVEERLRIARTIRALDHHDAA
jgi:hypothetical protein